MTGRDHEGALEYFGRAAELGHEGAPLQIEGVELERRVVDFRWRAAEAGRDVSHFASVGSCDFCG